ncbi:MAG: orotidine-5'-phosphate decarboxylase [Firmicutes bacterium]|nr:orotidine-5'-phosphate decarboxylase [Bacillota bacterium]
MLDRIYLALDFPNKTEANNLLRELPKGLGVKIGLELFLKEGLNYVKEVRNLGYNVFLDLKFHDIPRTVYGAVLQVAGFCDIVNVHASGGLEMLQAAKEASLKVESPPKLIGVTVLTSLSEANWQSVGGAQTIVRAVEKRALLCKEAGLDGVVCSPLEAKNIKNVCGSKFVTVTPGIRLESGLKEDQKRTATPKEAINMSCDYLVIGRPITKATDPAKALNAILREMES